MKLNNTPKERLYDTAARLFYQHGYRATGVDTISAESGVGKMTLYRHYPTKDDLIVAFLKQSDADFWRYFELITQDAPEPRGKILAFFEALQAYVTSPACYGCPFINVATEYPQLDYPGHQVALAHKRSVQARFNQLAEAAGASQPQALADGLLLLMDGAYMAARMYGSSADNPASHLLQTVRQLLENHCQD